MTRIKKARFSSSTDTLSGNERLTRPHHLLNKVSAIANRNSIVAQTRATRNDTTAHLYHTLQATFSVLFPPCLRYASVLPSLCLRYATDTASRNILHIIKINIPKTEAERSKEAIRTINMARMTKNNKDNGRKSMPTEHFEQHAQDWQKIDTRASFLMRRNDLPIDEA